MILPNHSVTMFANDIFLFLSCQNVNEAPPNKCQENLCVLPLFTISELHFFHVQSYIFQSK